jgi:hypothetical protein
VSRRRFVRLRVGTWWIAILSAGSLPLVLLRIAPSATVSVLWKNASR